MSDVQVQCIPTLFVFKLHVPYFWNAKGRLKYNISQNKVYRRKYDCDYAILSVWLRKLPQAFDAFRNAVAVMSEKVAKRWFLN